MNGLIARRLETRGDQTTQILIQTDETEKRTEEKRREEKRGWRMTEGSK